MRAEPPRDPRVEEAYYEAMEEARMEDEARDARTIAIVAAVLMTRFSSDMDEALDTATGLLEGGYQRARGSGAPPAPPAPKPAPTGADSGGNPFEDDDLPF